MKWISNLIAKYLDKGEVVCFPVDTVYAIAADPTKLRAINKIYKIKKRNIYKPISLFIPNIIDINTIAKVSDEQIAIIHSNAKEPITWILEAKKNNKILPFYHNKSVAIRLPISELTIRIMKKIKRPIAATSMNISKCKPISTIQEMQSFVPKHCKIITYKNLRPTGKASKIIDIRDCKTQQIIRQ